MKFKAILFSLLVATATLSSCGKYDEGPGMSLRSKKARVAGTWTIESWTVNGQEFTPFLTLGGFKNWEFTKDGAFTMNYNDPADNQKGKWEFTSNDEKIKFTFDGETPVEATIYKLKNKSMWVELTTDGDKNYIKFKQ